MGGYISLAATRGCRATLILTTAALALGALLLSFTGTASAAPAAKKVFPATPAGLTEPSGIAVTPDGRLWASDAMRGLCRVNVEAGTLEEDAYCAPEVEEIHGPEGVEGTEPPAATPTRPTATFAIAFDSTGCDVNTPPDQLELCNFYVAEGSSAGSGVWRMHWNSQTGTIDAATKIYTDGVDQRVMGLALAPGGAVDFAAKRNSQILRIKNAAMAEPGVAPTFIGNTATGDQATAIANLDGKTYLVEGGRLSVIDVPGRTATLLDDPPAGSVVSSVVADTERHLLHVGTARPQLTDEVLTFDGSRYLPGAYDHDFAGVTSMTFDLDGSLYVAHDPTAALSPGVDALGQAEVFLRARTTPNPPDVTWTDRPDAVVNGGPVHFAFTADPAPYGASFQCRVDGGDPFACNDGSWSSSTLGEGSHQLTVRAANVADPGPGDWGVARHFGFRVDATKPEVAIDARTPTTAVGGNLRLRFTANENSVAFTCKVDEGDPFGCGSPEDLVLALGAHTISVTATDAAGNVSDPVEWHVTAVPVPPVGVIPVTGGGSSPTPKAAPAPAPTRPAVVPLSPRQPRIDISVPCVAVSASRRARAEYEISRGRARIDYDAPSKARYAKFTLRRAGAGRREARIVETLGYARVRTSGSYRSSVALTRGQRRLVRRGAMRLAVAYGTCRTQVGRWQWISDSDDAREAQR
jgi:hypothetical protein